MPTTMNFNTPAAAKSKAKLAKEIAKANALAEGPAEPIADEAEFRGWCLDKPTLAKVLDTIIFRWKVSVIRIKGTPGYWAVYSLDQWAAWAKLPRRTLQSALTDLEAEGLIERDRSRFAGSKVRSYIRPTILALDLSRKSDLIHRLGPAVSGPVGAIGSAIGSAISGAIGSATDHTYFPTVLPLHLINKKDGEVPSGLAVSQIKIQEGGKIEEKKEEPPASSGSPAGAWIDAMAKSYPDKWVKLMPVDKKMLADFAKGCPDGHAADVISYVVAHWPAFVSAAGIHKPPSTPRIGTALKFRAEAVNLWLAKNGLVVDAAGNVVAKPAPATFMKPKATASAKSQTAPEDEPMTAEELLADMLNDDDGTPPTLAEVMEAMQGV